MHEHQIYKSLSKLRSSDFYGLCTDQIKALIPLSEAKRYLTFLTLQNEKNKSNLDKISELQSVLEQSRQYFEMKAIQPLGKIRGDLSSLYGVGS